MSRYGDPSLAELLPAYYCNNLISNRGRQSNVCKSICSHLITMITAVALCLGGYYYYENVYIPISKQTLMASQDQPMAEHGKMPLMDAKKAEEPSTSVNLIAENLNKELQDFRNQLASDKNWRSTINAYLTKMQWEQDIKINDAIKDALEIHEADGIGLMDYAASYAGGVILEISKDTKPHPTHRPLSIFQIVNVDLLSSPEEIIRPCVLPGSCFAFRSETASVKIRLGKAINIGGVTLSHASRYLIGTEGMLSAPKDFEVYAYEDRFDDSGTFLGKFTFDIMGKQHQTFPVKAKNEIFEEVELVILNNYGKSEYTCVYRFRVHKRDAGSSDKSTSMHEGGRSGEKKKVRKCC